MVIAAGIYFHLSAGEWRWVIAGIGLVLLAEAFNTAIERLGDAVTVEPNDHIRFAKDVSAAAVLIAVIVALLLALTIFGPRVAGLFR